MKDHSSVGLDVVVFSPGKVKLLSVKINLEFELFALKQIL